MASVLPLAQSFTFFQNGNVVNPSLLLNAAGADRILTQAEASQVPGLLAFCQQTGQLLNLATDMAGKGIAGIDFSNINLNGPSTDIFNLNTDVTVSATVDKKDDAKGDEKKADAKGGDEKKADAKGGDAKAGDAKGKPVPLADVAKGFDTLQNGKPIDPAVLVKAAGDDGILTQKEAEVLKNVICINKATGETLNIADCMAKNGVAAIDLKGAAPAGGGAAKGGAADAVPLSEVAKGFDAKQNGKPVELDVLKKAAGKDGILTQEEAKALKDVQVTNKKTGEVLVLAECMAKNGVAAINLDPNAKPPAAPPPPAGGAPPPAGGAMPTDPGQLLQMIIQALTNLIGSMAAPPAAKPPG